MEINNVFSPVPFYASKRYWHSNKWYTYGQKCPIIMTAEKTLPFQLVVSPGVTLSSFTIKKADNDTSVMTVNTAGNYFSIDAEAYSIIQVKACAIGTLPYGNYYYALTLSDGSTYISDIIAVISDMSKCIKITYKNVENLYFSSGHIDFTNDFVFELYLPTTIGKPEYEYEEELTKRLGYKFVESQVVNKVYKFTFPATEQLCDAYRFVRMCDYIRIDTYNPDFSDYDHYNVIYLSSEVEWLDNGDIASVETSFETDSIVQKLQDYSRTQLVNFYNALLSNSDEVLKFDDETIAQYYNNYLQSIDGKMIRQLNAVSSISDNTVIAIDENNGTGAANKILLKPLLINTVAEQLRASEVLANFQQHINNSSIHITVDEKAILSLFGVDDNGDVYVKGDKGFYTNSFISAKGKSSSAGGGGSASALYQLVDVLANSTNDGVQGATTNSVLMYNGTKWYAGTIDAGLDEAALKSYLDTNKYTTTTYVDNQLDTKADKTALSAYLPLTGGTITGNLTVNDAIYVGATNYVYHTGNLAGDNAWITLASNTISHKTIHANNITLIASSGQFVTGYAVDKAGHVTSISQRALNASDIPNIAITQVTGLQDALDKKVDTAFFARVFGLLDANGNEIAVNDVATVADSIKAKFGLWTEQYISAKGKNSSAGDGGGVSALYQLVDVLANSTNDGVLNATNGSVLMYNGTKWYAGTIDTGLDEAALKAYLDANKYTTTTYVDSKLDMKADKTALNAYATLTYVNDELSGTNSTVSALTEKVNNFLEGTDTDGIINKWKELEAFLAGQTQTSTLADLLNVKAFASTKIVAGTGLTGGGDLTADRTLSLATSGVTAGTYPKVTVDKYGRATAGASLSASDIPNLSWNKITSGKPTTLAGYGITDGVNSVTVNGNGNAITAASISNHVLTLTKDATYLPKATFDDLFEKVNIGTPSSPVYAIRAKYGFYSDEFISAKGVNSSSGGGLTSALYQLVDVAPNSTNDGVLNAANGSVLMYNGSKWQAGNVVTDISPLTLNVNGSSLFTYDGKSSITANLTVPTKVSQLTNDSGYLTAITKAQVEGVLTGNITSHTHSYLPLSGGTVTGTLNAPQFAAQSDGVYTNYWLYLPESASLANTRATRPRFGRFDRAEGSAVLQLGASNIFDIVDSAWSTVLLRASYSEFTYKGTPISLDGHTHSFASLTSKPTTISGYGITDAITTNNIGSQSVNYANSAGNADTVDGYHAEVMVKSLIDSRDNFTSFTNRAFFQTAFISGQGDFCSLVIPTWRDNSTNTYYTTELRFSLSSYNPRIRFTSPAGTSDWHTLATTVDNVASATKLQTARTISLTGSVTGSISFDGTSNVSISTSTNHTHSFESLTSKPTTISGYGITDTYTKTETNNILSKYLPLSGGKISTSIYNPLTIENTASDTTSILFKGISGELGYLAFIGVSNPVYMAPSGYAYSLLHTANYNSYSPKLDGTGASGTWGISITGNAVSATNADTVDGYHADQMVKVYIDNTDNFTSFTNRPYFKTSFISSQGDFASLVIPTWNANNQSNYYITEIRFGLQSFHPLIRYTHNDVTSDWKTIALLTDNVASATKLQTARTIWGQSFDGTGNVNGHLSIGKIFTQQLANRAELSIVSSSDEPCDLWLGANGELKWSINTRASDESYALSFYNTTGTGYVMRILTNGNVGIGTTSPSVKLHVAGDIAATGAVTAKASSSDIRLKTDITDYKALSIIRNHRSIKYHWNAVAKANADIFNDDYWHYGLIAQDVQRDMPQMVSDVFKDYLVINYERLIPICWKGLQEVDDEVAKLKKKVRKLEMEIRELKQKEDRL